MLKNLVVAPALLAAVLAPAAAVAQAERSSPVPSYHLVQLSVHASKVAAPQFQAQTQAIESCGDAIELSRTLGAEMTRNRFIRASQMPTSVRTMVEELESGEATPVYTYDGAVLRVLVLCNRA